MADRQATKSDGQYFAALPKDEMAAELQTKIDKFYDYIRISGIYYRLRRSYLTYHGFGPEGVGNRIGI